MKKGLMLVDCDVDRADHLYREIGKVRCWLTGFREAGKSGPPGEDSLRQMQVILKDSINKAASK